MPEIFSPEINWLNPLVEEYEYETTIFITHDGSEQRQSLMDTAHRRLTYNITALDAREAARLEGLIRKVQGEPCYVPYWRGARYVTNIVGNVIFADTLFAGFEIDNWAILIRDAHTVGVAKITDVQANTVTLATTIPGTWPFNRTKIVPAFLGQLAPESDVDYAAKFAKTAQVVFDLHPIKNRISADCNWKYTETYPPYIPDRTPVSYAIDPTGGPSGGPALMMTIPAGSYHGGSVFMPAAFIRIIGLEVGAIYNLEAKIKTDWNVASDGINDGTPGAELSIADPSTGTTLVTVTSGAFNTWQIRTSAVLTDAQGQVFPIFGVTEGSTGVTDRHAWLAEVVVRDNANNVIWTCLPAIDNTPLPQTLIFSPLSCLHRPGTSLQKITRAVDQLSSPAGVFSVRPRAIDPLTSHSLDLVFLSPDEWYAFRDFHDLMFGAFGAFWVPSYQQDLTPIGTIGAADVNIIIQDVGYTVNDFPSLNRRQIAFVQPNGSFVKRSITNAVNNGNGTETITINASLGFSFQQNNANGICFLWYGRFVDDISHMEWVNSDHGTLSIVMVELRDPPDGGSGNSADGYLPNVP